MFGSAVRDDFSSASDVDVLVDFHPGQTPGLRFFFALQDELTQILGRSVDLTTLAAVQGSQNYIRRRSILESAVDVYAEG